MPESPPTQSSLFSDPDGDESLSGSIERITFQADESDFVILKLLPEGQGEAVTAKGELAFAEVGEFVTLTGRWQNDARWGPQFRFREARAAAPKTREGLQKYLSSSLVEGIGAKFAARLLDHFGEDLLNIVDSQPERLREVAGIGKKRAEQIQQALQAQRQRRDTIVALYGLGLSSGHASELIKRFGEQAVSQVRHAPYELARDIRGIGFLTADRIASRAGIAHDSPERARAGLLHVLQEMSNQGDTIVPADELLGRAARALQVEAPVVEAALLEARKAGEVEQDELLGEVYVGLPELLHHERLIARGLLELGRAEASALPEFDVERALEWVAGRIGFTLTAAQQRAVAMGLSSPIGVITGGPGVGKTTVLRALVEVLEAKGVRLGLAAPTGRAAKRLEETTGRPAKTIHRLLEFNPGTGGFKRGRREPLELDALIVDESSMLDVQLGSRLVQAVPLGATLLFVGDKDQLPSIGPGAVLRDLLESQVLPAVELKTVFRQAETSAIVRNAHRVNRGEMPELGEGREEGGQGDFFFIERPDPAATLETIAHIVSERIPRAFQLDPVKDVQVLSPMHRGEAGTQRLNERLQQCFIRDPQAAAIERNKVKYHVGDKVMQLKNDYDKDVFNGDIGVVSAVDVAGKSLEVQFPERAVRYEKGDLSGLTLAYAASIHKSQGSEFPAVVIPVLTQHFVMLKRNLLYTGMTRARQLVILVGQRRAIELAVGDDVMHHRRTTLGVRLQQALRAAEDGRG